ncbi:MAG: hypothetical protein Q8S33_33600 [Myxococcales bacterium]|nr:hypothetical protein [Myxococcales bacterium]MDP3505323.1 hypothetical protein [Myxococcales bacterium]
MKAMKNLVHLGILGVWLVAGLLFTLKAVFVLSGFVPVALFWGWFAAFAAVTSFVVGKFDHPLGALATHGGAVLVMQALPMALPFALARLGLDLLSGKGLPF